VLAASLPGVSAEAPTAFIDTLGSQGLEVIRSSTTLAQKAQYFHQVLHQDFDLPGISRFVLGPYWRVASPAQQQEFPILFENYTVRVDGQRFAQYGDETFRVTGSRTNPAGVIVTSQILRPQGAPVEIDWQLGIRDGRYKITDVIIAGVSMALSHRSEFAEIIQRGGGQVAALLAAMRQ